MISPKDVQKLRETSGAGIMDCKKALEESKGDFDNAIKYLREKGKASAAKRAGRVTGQGIVSCWVGTDGKKGGIVELGCETDFVARTPEVSNFVKDLSVQIGENDIKAVDKLQSQSLGSGKDTVETVLKEKIAKIGENLIIKKVGCLGNGGSKNSIIGHYIHAAQENIPECGSLGVLLEVKSDKNDADIQTLLGELCMQVAATAPKWVRKEDVPSELVDKEKEIYKEQCKSMNKPEKAWDKITTGKLNDFYKQFCLMQQSHVRDSSGKTSIQSILDEAAKKAGTEVNIQNFFRFKVGEE